MKRLVASLTVTILFISEANAQGYFPPTTSNLYQFNYTQINPAFAGIDGTKFTLMTTTFVPKSDYTLTSLYLAGETKVRSINSGIGVSLSAWDAHRDYYHGLNIIYNYQVNVGNLVLALGATFVAQRVGLRPDDRGGRYYSVDGMTTRIGAALRGEKFFAGLSIDNSVHSDFTALPFFGQEIATFRTHVIVGRDFHIAENFRTTHSIYLSIPSGNDVSIDINNSFLIKKMIVLGVSVQFIGDEIPVRLNGGVRIKDRAQIVAMLYSSTYDYDVPKKFSGQLMFQLMFNNQEQE